MNPTLEVADSPGPARGASFVAELSEGKRWTNYFGLDGSLMSPPGTSRQAAFFAPTVANGALRTWLDLPPVRASRE
jgi:hypothetical protein